MTKTIDFIRLEWRTLRIGLIHTFFSGFGQTFFLSLFSGFIIEEFELSRTSYGGLYSIATLLSALTLPIPGAWIDRWQLKRFSLLTGVVVLIACGLFAWSPNLITLGLSLYLLRLGGQGLMSHIAGTTMSRHYGNNRGKALSLTNLGYPLSEALIPLLAVFIINSAYGWRTAPFVMAMLILLVFIPFSQLWLSQSSEMNTPPLKRTAGDKELLESKDWTRKEALNHPFIYLILPIYLAPPFLITGFFIQQSSMDQLYTWDFTHFGIALVWFSILRFMGSLFSGPILDKFHAQVLIRYYTLPLLIGVVITYMGWGPYYLFALAGLTAGAGGSIKTALLNETYGSKHLGGIRSFATSIMAVSTGVSPILFGLVLDLEWGFGSILIGSMVFILIAQISILFAQRYFNPLEK